MCGIKPLVGSDSPFQVSEPYIRLFKRQLSRNRCRKKERLGLTLSGIMFIHRKGQLCHPYVQIDKIQRKMWCDPFYGLKWLP